MSVGTAPPTDQLRALSLNRLDGVVRSTSFVGELPFKCPSYPRLGERQLSSSTALDELSLSPRLSSNANLSQDLDASDLITEVGSAADVSPRQPGVALTRSVSVRTAAYRPLTAGNLRLVAPSPAAQPIRNKSTRQQAEVTSEQRLPFPEYPATSGGTLRRSMSCPLHVVFYDDGDEELNRRVAAGYGLNDGADGGQFLTTDSASAPRDVTLPTCLSKWRQKLPC